MNQKDELAEIVRRSLRPASQPGVAAQRSPLYLYLLSHQVVRYCPNAEAHIWLRSIGKIMAFTGLAFLFIVFLNGFFDFLTPTMLFLGRTFLVPLKPLLVGGASSSLLISQVLHILSAASWIFYLSVGSIIVTKTIQWNLNPTHIAVLDNGLAMVRFINAEKYELQRRILFANITKVTIERPSGRRSVRDYLINLFDGSSEPFSFRYGDLYVPEERKYLLKWLEANMPAFDQNLFEVLKPPAPRQSYTELWLKELSAPPKRDKLTPLLPGATVNNSAYRIISKIGVGGQGTVYLAQSTGGNVSSLLPPPLPSPTRQTPVLQEQGLSLPPAARHLTGDCASDEDRVSSHGEEAPSPLPVVSTIEPRQGASLESSSEEVVLKEFVLPVYPDPRVRKQAAEKFQLEAQMLSRLSHPKIVGFRDLFIEDHRAYLVLERVEGCTLETLVEREGKQPVESVLDLALQMCDILEYLHNQEPPIVHRDFTPDNLILDNECSLKLVDFSVAQELQPNVTGSVVGKPSYIAPEQFRGKPTTQSDIYSLGATMFFLLTASAPPPITCLHAGEILLGEAGENCIEELTLSVNGQTNGRRIFKPVSSDRDKIAGLDAVIAGCTQLDTENRYKDIASLKADLLCLAAGHQ